MTKGCRHICKSIHFQANVITSCSSNTCGLTFQENPVNLDCQNIETKYKELLESFKQGNIPDCCQNCFELQEDYDLSQIKDVKIKTFYISNWLHCNAYCRYCVHNGIKNKRNLITNKIQKSETYDVMPFLNKLQEKDMVARHPEVYITGGEPALLKELHDVVNFFLKEEAKYFMVFSSCIQYSKDIHKLLQDKDIITELLVSPDSGNRELYKKIKCVDKFNDVINNLKKYNQGILNPKSRIIAKYISIKDINDNEKDLKEFIDCMYKIGVKHIRLDVEYNYPDKTNSPIPSLFGFGTEYARNLGLNVDYNGIALHDLKNV